jgi:hypothetical protein
MSRGKWLVQRYVFTPPRRIYWSIDSKHQSYCDILQYCGDTLVMGSDLYVEDIWIA